MTDRKDSCPENSLVRKAVSKDPFQEVDSWLKLKTGSWNC